MFRFFEEKFRRDMFILTPFFQDFNSFDTVICQRAQAHRDT